MTHSSARPPLNGPHRVDVVRTDVHAKMIMRDALGWQRVGQLQTDAIDQLSERTEAPTMHEQVHDELFHATSAVMKRLVSVVRDPEFQSDLRRLAKVILETVPETEEPGASEASDGEQFPRSTATGRRPTEERENPKHALDRSQPTDSRTSVDSGPLDPTAADASSSPAKNNDPRRAVGRSGLQRPPQATPKSKTQEPVVTASDAARQLWPSHNRDAVGKSAKINPANGQQRDAGRRIIRVDSAHDQIDLKLVAQRMRKKAEGSRWSAERRRLSRLGPQTKADVMQGDQEIIERAQDIEGCYLWMNSRSAPEPEDLQRYVVLGQTFDVCASAITLINRLLREGEEDFRLLQDAAALLAEAQSMVRAAVRALPYDSDSDQVLVFHWLRQLCKSRRIKIERFMMAKDKADPSNAADLEARIRALDSLVSDSIRNKRRQNKLLGKIAYETGQILDDETSSTQRMPVIMRSVEELITGGMPPSNADLRDLLLPVVGMLEAQEALPEKVQRVMCEVERFLAANPELDEPELDSLSDTVRTVADRLEGRSVLLIGGDCRPPQYEAIKKAFHLDQLYWFSVKEHTSTSVFDPYIKRPDVVLVLLAIRWASHSYGNISEVCNQVGTPLVRLPAGYNPNQLAHQIFQQCGDRLDLSERASNT